MDYLFYFVVGWLAGYTVTPAFSWKAVRCLFPKRIAKPFAPSKPFVPGTQLVKIGRRYFVKPLPPEPSPAPLTEAPTQCPKCGAVFNLIRGPAFRKQYEPASDTVKHTCVDCGYSVNVAIWMNK